MELELTNSRPRQPGAVDVFSFRVTRKESGHVVRRRACGTRIQRLAGDLHSRSLNQPGIDSVSELDGAKTATRVHVHDRRETSLKIALSALNHDHRSVLDRFIRLWAVRVNVAVDHSGQHRGATQIE